MFLTITVGQKDIFSVGDVDFRIQMEHAQFFDIEVYLISPSGTRALVFADLVSRGTLDVTFDDQAAATVANQGDDISGTFFSNGNPSLFPGTPVGLSAFSGENPPGEWTVEIYDKNFQDVGSVLNASLILREFQSCDGTTQSSTATTTQTTSATTSATTSVPTSTQSTSVSTSPSTSVSTVNPTTQSTTVSTSASTTGTSTAVPTTTQPVVPGACVAGVLMDGGGACTCPNNCRSCNAGGNVCDICTNNRFLLEGTCVDTCPAGFIGVGSGERFRRCEIVGDDTTQAPTTTTPEMTTSAGSSAWPPAQPEDRFTGSSNSFISHGFELAYV